MKNKVTIFWFRRDLRLTDNAGLYHALRSGIPVLPIFIFDTTILQQLDKKADARVSYIHQCVQQLQDQLQVLGSGLLVKHGEPLTVLQEIAQTFSIAAIYLNRDYEPAALSRDKAVFEYFAKKNIAVKGYKDQVIFDRNEILKNDGTPYTVYTPYANKWKAAVNDFYTSSYPTKKYHHQFYKHKAVAIPTLAAIGFESTDIVFPPDEINTATITSYAETRDFPALAGTSRLSTALRFGTISIRQLVSIAQDLNQKFLGELIWRDFYQMILYHFPKTLTQAFKPAYDHIQWRNNEAEFTAWCQGKTGYPIVDAGMRELNATGFMHNRVRMITASFLTKHLLVDWRWGEAYFAEKLLDYDVASNIGGWQWAAGCGCDAAPYFRIFNPYIQTKKFDPQLRYIKKWVPEWDTDQYPAPVVMHEYARERCLKVYKAALNN